MDYHRLYTRLIAHARTYPPTGYTEVHHIVMRSMGGTDDPDNLVALTPRQHVLAHRLLWKMTDHPKALTALMMMYQTRPGKRPDYRVMKSREYAHARLAYAAYIATDEYKALIAEHSSKRWEDPSYRAFMADVHARYNSDPEWLQRKTDAITATRRTDASRSKTSEQSKRQWSDPEWVAKWHEATQPLFTTPEHREYCRTRALQMWSDPDFRERQRAVLLAATTTDAFRERISVTSKEMWARDGQVEKMSEAIKATRSTPESRAKTAAQAKRQWADPQFRATVTAKMKGGNRGSFTPERTSAWWAVLSPTGTVSLIHNLTGFSRDHGLTAQRLSQGYCIQGWRARRATPEEIAAGFVVSWERQNDTTGCDTTPGSVV